LLGLPARRAHDRDDALVRRQRGHPREHVVAARVDLLGALLEPALEVVAVARLQEALGEGRGEHFAAGRERVLDEEVAVDDGFAGHLPGRRVTEAVDRRVLRGADVDRSGHRNRERIRRARAARKRVARRRRRLALRASFESSRADPVCWRMMATRDLELLRHLAGLMAACLVLVWVMTRGRSARAGLRHVLAHPGLCVPAAMTTAGLALLAWLRPGAPVIESPFGTPWF